MDKKFRFKLDKDKIKLQLKDLGKKFVRKKSNFRNGMLLCVFFVLIGVGFAIYHNDERDDQIGELTLKQKNFANQAVEVNYGQEQPGFYNGQQAEKNFSLNYSNIKQSDESKKESGSRNKEGKKNETGDVQNDLLKSGDQRSRDQPEGVVTEALKPLSQLQNKLPGINLLKPVSGDILQDPGWYYNTTFDDWRFQKGIEFSGETGDIVMAAASGQVSIIKEDNYMGIIVVIQHEDGWSTEYGHLQRATVSPGERVSKGQEIGRIGITGMVVQPALYFSLKNKDGAIDPSKFFD